jgi:hypothetical protein
MALSAELPRLEQIAAAREPEPERTAELYGMRSHCLPMRLRIATQLADSPRPDPHPPGFRVRVGSLLSGRRDAGPASAHAGRRARALACGFASLKLSSGTSLVVAVFNGVAGVAARCNGASGGTRATPARRSATWPTSPRAPRLCPGSRRRGHSRPAAPHSSKSCRPSWRAEPVLPDPSRRAAG